VKSDARKSLPEDPVFLGASSVTFFLFFAKNSIGMLDALFFQKAGNAYFPLSRL
jgi:hypothetical protein